MAKPGDYMIVGTILLALEKGLKTEGEAVEECGELLKSGMLDLQYLYHRNEALYRKVEEWCRIHSPEL